MNEIPKIESKVLALHQYLKANEKDTEGDSWIFGHHPIIEKHLITFDSEDTKELEQNILKWNEEQLYDIADPLADTKNPLIDGEKIYGEIFLRIEDFEKLEYLIQNLGIITLNSKNERELEYYSKILDKTILLNTKLGNGYNHLIGIIRDKIEKIKAHNIR